MGATLLLNASYEPLMVIPITRAVVLVLQEKADIVKEGEGNFSSPSTSVPTPSVIRLRYYVQVPYRAHIRLSRSALMARDNRTCKYCGKTATTIDHVLPRSRGGTHTWGNVVAACSPCNAKKASKLLSELGWELDFKPFAPVGIRWLIVGLATMDPEWESYILMV